MNAAQLTPMFFGSAMTNFGVRPFLDAFLELAPPPAPPQGPATAYRADRREVHRLRLQDSGEHGPAAPRPHRVPARRLRQLRKGMSAFHSRLGKEVRLAKPSQFLAAERTAIEDAWPGDVIGLFDPGQYRIGDTLARGRTTSSSRACRASRPSTSRWCAPKTRCAASRWKRASSSSPRKARIQIFQQLQMGMKDPIVGVVGALQFEVLQYRIEHEYGAHILLDRLPFSHARWVVGGLRRQDLRLGGQPPDGAGPRRPAAGALPRRLGAAARRGEAPRAEVPLRGAAAALERGEARRVETLECPTALAGGASQLKNSTAAVSRLYIAPVRSTSWLVCSSFTIGLSPRIRAMVSSTFLRATASTKAAFLLVRSPT